jgi:hypothetical protein
MESGALCIGQCLMLCVFFLFYALSIGFGMMLFLLVID